MSEPNPTFAETFERLRLGRGWTPAEVARQLGVYPTEVSRWRRGLGGISIRNVRRVADLFGVDRVWLENIAGYTDSNSGDTLDTADSIEAERQLWRSRFDELVEKKVPRWAREAYIAACEALADAYNQMHTGELSSSDRQSLSRPASSSGDPDPGAHNPNLAESSRHPRRAQQFTVVTAGV